MTTPTMSFFSTGTELGVLEKDVRGLRASVHAPPLWRADQTLADIRGAILRTHEAHLQVKIATSAGYEEHRQIWQAKVDALDQRIANATAALRAVVDELRKQKFHRYCAILKLQKAALRFLYTASTADGLAPISRHFLRTASFIVSSDHNMMTSTTQVSGDAQT